MAQYVFTMHRLSKVVPPKREILKNISLSFFPGAKIGVLGLNGSGKSTLLKIMAGVDTEFDGEARPGDTLRYHATIEQAKDIGASVNVTADLGDRRYGGAEIFFARFSAESTEQTRGRKLFDPRPRFARERLLSGFFSERGVHAKAAGAQHERTDEQQRRPRFEAKLHFDHFPFFQQRLSTEPLLK